MPPTASNPSPAAAPHIPRHKLLARHPFFNGFSPPPAGQRPRALPPNLDRHRLLPGHPFFNGFNRTVIDRLVSPAVTRRVKKGTVLFRKGDPGSSLYAVCAGLVRISVPSAQG